MGILNKKPSTSTGSVRSDIRFESHAPTSFGSTREPSLVSDASSSVRSVDDVIDFLNRISLLRGDSNPDVTIPNWESNSMILYDEISPSPKANVSQISLKPVVTVTQSPVDVAPNPNDALVVPVFPEPTLPQTKLQSFLNRAKHVFSKSKTKNKTQENSTATIPVEGNTTANTSGQASQRKTEETEYFTKKNTAPTRPHLTKNGASSPRPFHAAKKARAPERKTNAEKDANPGCASAQPHLVRNDASSPRPFHAAKKARAPERKTNAKKYANPGCASAQPHLVRNDASSPRPFHAAKKASAPERKTNAKKYTNPGCASSQPHLTKNGTSSPRPFHAAKKASAPERKTNAKKDTNPGCASSQPHLVRNDASLPRPFHAAKRASPSQHVGGGKNEASLATRPPVIHSAKNTGQVRALSINTNAKSTLAASAKTKTRAKGASGDSPNPPLAYKKRWQPRPSVHSKVVK